MRWPTTLLSALAAGCCGSFVSQQYAATLLEIAIVALFVRFFIRVSSIPEEEFKKVTAQQWAKFIGCYLAAAVAIGAATVLLDPQNGISRTVGSLGALVAFAVFPFFGQRQFIPPKKKIDV